MIDIKFLRENPEVVKENIRKKFQEHKLPLVDEVIELDEQARKTQQEADEIRASRNKLSKQIGMLMGQGKNMNEAMEEVQMVVEGVYSAKAAYALSQKYNISMPIVEKVCAILFDNKDSREAITELMQRSKRVENTNLTWD